VVASWLGDRKDICPINTFAVYAQRFFLSGTVEEGN